jgi:hypothetical protein
MDQRLIKWEREFSNKTEAEKRFLVELNGLYKNQNSNEAKNLGPTDRVGLVGLKVTVPTVPPLVVTYKLAQAPE